MALLLKLSKDNASKNGCKMLSFKKRSTTLQERLKTITVLVLAKRKAYVRLMKGLFSFLGRNDPSFGDFKRNTRSGPIIKTDHHNSEAHSRAAGSINTPLNHGMGHETYDFRTNGPLTHTYTGGSTITNLRLFNPQTVHLLPCVLYCKASITSNCV